MIQKNWLEIIKPHKLGVVPGNDPMRQATIVAEPLTDGQIAKSGISRGLSRGARLLEEYYLEIIRQTSPTLESGSGRDVTIVLTEGIWLELKDIHAQGGIQ